MNGVPAPRKLTLNEAEARQSQDYKTHRIQFLHMLNVFLAMWTVVEDLEVD